MSSHETYATTWPTKKTMQPSPVSFLLHVDCASAGVSGRWGRGQSPVWRVGDELHSSERGKVES